MTVDEVLDIAIRLHQAGQLEEALSAYQIVLDVDPRNFNGIHLQAVALHQLGNSQEALPLLGKAIEARPDSFDAHCNLSAVLYALGNFRAHRKTVGVTGISRRVGLWWCEVFRFSG